MHFWSSITSRFGYNKPLPPTTEQAPAQEGAQRGRSYSAEEISPVEVRPSAPGEASSNASLDERVAPGNELPIAGQVQQAVGQDVPKQQAFVNFVKQFQAPSTSLN